MDTGSSVGRYRSRAARDTDEWNGRNLDVTGMCRTGAKATVDSMYANTFSPYLRHSTIGR